MAQWLVEPFSLFGIELLADIGGSCRALRSVPMEDRVQVS